MTLGRTLTRRPRRHRVQLASGRRARTDRWQASETLLAESSTRELEGPFDAGDEGSDRHVLGQPLGSFTAPLDEDLPQ